MSRTITIYGETFEISAPYDEGHTCTAAEARSLNQTRAENISNNFRAKVKAAQEGKDGAGTLDDVRAAMAEYDKEYVFNMAATRTRSTMSPLEKECIRLAKIAITNKIKAAGTTQKAWIEANGKDAFDSKVAEVAEMEPIVKMAKENLKRAEKQGELEIAV